MTEGSLKDERRMIAGRQDPNGLAPECAKGTRPESAGVATADKNSMRVPGAGLEPARSYEQGILSP